MPALSIGHGSPMNTLEDNGYTRAGRKLGQATARMPMPARGLRRQIRTLGRCFGAMTKGSPSMTCYGVGMEAVACGMTLKPGEETAHSE